MKESSVTYLASVTVWVIADLLVNFLRLLEPTLPKAWGKDREPFDEHEQVQPWGQDI